MVSKQLFCDFIIDIHFTCQTAVKPILHPQLVLPVVCTTKRNALGSSMKKSKIFGQLVLMFGIRCVFVYMHSLLQVLSEDCKSPIAHNMMGTEFINANMTNFSRRWCFVPSDTFTSFRLQQFRSEHSYIVPSTL